MTDKPRTDDAFLGAVPTVRERHPLGLPPGSVRALLTLLVVGLFWLMLLLPENADKPIHIPFYLYYLTFLVLGSYFATRGHTQQVAGSRGGQPLHLPRGSIRLLLIVGFVATFIWSFYHNPDILTRLVPSERATAKGNVQAYVPLVLFGSFFIGVVLGRMAAIFLGGRGGLPAWYQDLQAWISLLAILVLGVEIIIRLVIYPRAAPERQFEMPYWESLVAALVAFYFGARSSS